ncbi:hypothetical protein LCGC14_0363740 [marine sediment metagenome]|uniref:Uncharacterized protein n=1 Tax=marine sediment metagenome TaxID=412755 RepID=A0A0F9T725_9ZZZZ
MRDMMTTIDMTTGKLDRCISEMKVWAKRAEAGYLDEADVQTIKHHAEDMKAMGDYVLRKVEFDYREKRVVPVSAGMDQGLGPEGGL